MTDIPWMDAAIDGVSITKVRDLKALSIDIPGVEALLFVQGAHLAQWTPRGQKPVIFTSEATRLETGIPIRGGIPVIVPWFGPADKGLHGWARNLQWSLESVGQTDEGAVTVEFSLDNVDRGLYAESLSQKILFTLGKELRIALTVKNTGSSPIDVEMALHAYWNVDARNLTVRGLDSGGIDRTDDDSPVPPGPFEPLTGQTIDRFYPFAESITLRDRGNNRDIVISSPESVQAVAWNPGKAGAAASSDMLDDDWQKFICIEATRVRDYAVTLAASEEASLTLSAQVHPLPRTGS